MKNYSTSTSVLPFFTYTPLKNPWEVFRTSGSIHEVHPYVKAVLEERRIRSLRKYLDTIKE